MALLYTKHLAEIIGNCARVERETSSPFGNSNFSLAHLAGFMQNIFHYSAVHVLFYL